ncbi:hypothetical protein B0T20DRAFT_481020 [Sordaria brevicollis]|uniref:Uncharacterized protein n=1 Tax=Sordaria brevicollis TaxID=83679 RepID=A0AAE0P9S5_SORBR|nr:hypothetical protein B0T20DRAFT_481020 [Sordaria brevicollis]
MSGNNNTGEDNSPKYILFDRDWSAVTTLSVQAKRLVDHRLSYGISEWVLWAEQKQLRSLEDYQSIRWIFYNAMVEEIESRL